MKDFLIIYFILSVLAIIFYIIRWWIKSNDEPKINWQEKLARDVLEWCLELYPIKKKRPNLHLSGEKSNHYGEYSYHNNTITIYTKNNVLRTDLINTLIHEYFHYYMITSKTKLDIYAKQLVVYKIHDHPQEIVCNSLADTLTKIYLKK